MVSIAFEPDNGGSDTAARATAYFCTQSDLNTCREALLFDTNSDGVPDSGAFDPSSSPPRLGTVKEMAGFIYIDPTTAPGANAAEVKVCPRRASP